MVRPATAEVSARMKLVRQRNTAPELAVRQLLWALGLRYRTNVRSLPGSPDLANVSQGWALFVHGCFWHSHTGFRLATVPKKNRAWWVEKLNGNKKRDARKRRLLRERGLKVITVWQCQLARPVQLERRLSRELPR